MCWACDGRRKIESIKTWSFCLETHSTQLWRNVGRMWIYLHFVTIHVTTRHDETNGQSDISRIWIRIRSSPKEMSRGKCKQCVTVSECKVNAERDGRTPTKTHTQNEMKWRKHTRIQTETATAYIFWCARISFSSHSNALLISCALSLILILVLCAPVRCLSFLVLVHGFGSSSFGAACCCCSITWFFFVCDAGGVAIFISFLYYSVWRFCRCRRRLSLAPHASVCKCVGALHA